MDAVQATIEAAVAAKADLLRVHHGLFCVGCCWSLMLLMVVVGVGSLGWMLVFGAVMAAEFIAGRKGVFTMKDVLGLEKDQEPPE